jgi:hypothetical protein
MAPFAPAVSILNYANGRSGAVRFAGNHRVVYFAFGGYEAIADEKQRKIAMPLVLNWLNGFSLEHTPLRDTDDTTRARTVTAKINSTLSPLASVELYWDTDDALPFNKVAMTLQAGNEYRGDIPPLSRKKVEYFIFARTQKGYSSPIQKYSYLAGPDRIPPVFDYLSLIPNTIKNIGPYPVTVFVTDNIAVDPDAVWILYRSTLGKQDSVKMSQNPGDQRFFNGNILGPFAHGDTVFYRASARDVAKTANRGVSAEKMFVVGLDDFESYSENWSVQPNGWGRSGFVRFSGQSSANSNPPGAYGQKKNTALTLAIPLDFSNLAAASLSFMEQHFFEPNQEDFGVVEISGDGGRSWTRLREEFRGIQGQWQEQRYSLAAYTGAGFNDVRIRFRSQTDEQPQLLRRGWFIDDVRITAHLDVSVPQPVETALMPATFALSQNYPNPFSPASGKINSASASTLIGFDLPSNAQVEISVYDLLGRRIATLIDAQKPAGLHTVTWNGKDETGQSVAAGIYFYRLKAVSAAARQVFQAARKMMVQR